MERSTVRTNPNINGIAEDVSKPRAICTECGQLATYTQKLKGTDSQIEVGSQNNYEARCRQHFSPEILSNKHLDFVPEDDSMASI